MTMDEVEYLKQRIAALERRIEVWERTARRAHAEAKREAPVGWRCPMCNRWNRTEERCGNPTCRTAKADAEAIENYMKVDHDAVDPLATGQ